MFEDEDWVRLARHRTAVSMRRDRHSYRQGADPRLRILVVVTLVMNDQGVRYSQQFTAGGAR